MTLLSFTGDSWRDCDTPNRERARGICTGDDEPDREEKALVA